MTVAQVARELAARAADIHGVMRRHPIQTRQMLRKLLVGRMEMTPFATDEAKGYAFKGQGSYGGLFSAATVRSTGSVPNGIQKLPVWEVRGFIKAA